MMNIRHFFDNADEKTIDRITENYPLLNSKDKERLYAMSKKKYNRVQTENSPNSIEVSGVERYRKPVWHKVLSAVAAAVVVLGGIGGSVALMRRNNDVNISENELSQSAEIDTTEIEGIAQQLTDEFFDLKNIISSRGASYDENDTLTYKIGIFVEGLENLEEHIYERTFYKVTDERFKCSQDIYNALKNITSSTYFPEEKYEKATIPWEFSWDYATEEEKSLELFCNLGTDVSMFENGSNIDRDFLPTDENYNYDLEDDDNWEPAYSIWMADYIEHSGSLYMLTPDYVHDPVGVVYDYNDIIEITDITADSFTAVRYADISHNENIIKRAEFKFIFENGEWCIDDFSECVLDTEGVGSEETDYTAIAQQLSDKLLEFEYLIDYGNVSYDENDSISFTVINSEDLEWTNKYGNYVATFYKVTDPRFTCRQDIYNELRCLFLNTCFNKDSYYGATFFGYGLQGNLGSDLSDYENGGTIDLAVNNHTDSEHIIIFCFCEYNGELYVSQRYSEFHEYTSDVTIKETGENSFIAARNYTKHYADEDVTVERCFEIVLEAGKWKIDNVYVSDEESENESKEEYEYLDIATELTDKFFDMRSVIELCDVSYDENDFITYNCYSVVNPEDLAEKYGVDLSGKEQRVDFLHTRKLYKVIDARFNSCQNIYDALRKLTSTSLLPEENYENVVLPWDSMVTTPIALLGTDVSMYESGSDIYDSYFADFENRTFDTSDSDNWEAALSAFGSLYVEYNGSLYVVGDMNYSYIPVDDIAVRTVDRDRFTATRHFVLSPDREGYETECYKFEFVLENGEWKIDNVEMVVSDEEAAGIAIVSYVNTLIHNDTDKYGNIHINPDVFDFGFEILSYNGENNCTAKVILTDYDYVDALEITAEIDLNEQKVISAEVKELY